MNPKFGFSKTEVSGGKDLPNSPGGRLPRAIIHQLEGCGSCIQRAVSNSKPPGDKLEKNPWL
jgi:hypothetical protein